MQEFFTRVFEHLLPRGLAWVLNPLSKTLRGYYEGLAALPASIQADIDAVYGDATPGATRDIPAWEDQFNLTAAADTLSEDQRRERIRAAWLAVGGQSPKYIQDVLQANGFDVWLYEFWEYDSGDETMNPNPSFPLPTGTYGDTGASLLGFDPKATIGLCGNLGLGVKSNIYFRFRAAASSVAKGKRIHAAKLSWNLASNGQVVDDPQPLVGLGLLMPDGNWESFGFSPSRYANGFDLPNPLGWEQNATGLLPGVLHKDRWAATFNYTAAQVAAGETFSIGDESTNPTIVVPLSEILQEWIDDPALTSSKVRRVGFVLQHIDASNYQDFFLAAMTEHATEAPPEFFVEWEDSDVAQPLTVHDPNDFLDDDTPRYIAACGEPLAECGEATAILGETANNRGYLLVNKVNTSVTTFLGCGDVELACDEALALCGESLGVVYGTKSYAIPADPDRWRYILYVAGETWPNAAKVDSARREEFEDLLLKLRPAQQWLGVMVDYSTAKRARPTKSPGLDR